MIDPISSLYDYELILSRLNHLRQVSKLSDFDSVLSALRAGLLRNLGGSNNPRLFSSSFLGSKSLTEDYVDKVVEMLEVIDSGEIDGQSVGSKIEFFSETLQSFGRTALILEGGISFGGVHLGVIKTLFDHKLLPKIIMGSSMGALIAAYVCVHSNDTVSLALSYLNHPIILFIAIQSFE